MRGRHRPPAPPGAGGSPAPEQATLRLRHVVALVAAGLGLVAALLAGWWGLGTDRGAEHVPPATGWVQVEDGWVRIDEVVDRSLAHRRMPNMQTMPDADPVPEGHVRYLVQLSIAADGRTLRWRPRDIHISGTGLPAAPAHTVELGDGVVPEGSTVRGSVTVDVPVDARDLVLSFGSTRIPLTTASRGDDTDEVPHGPPEPRDRDH